MRTAGEEGEREMEGRTGGKNGRTDSHTVLQYHRLQCNPGLTANEMQTEEANNARGETDCNLPFRVHYKSYYR